jgi:kynurenine 3-monooxygenase
LSEATLHIGENGKRSLEEKKYDIVFGADGAFLEYGTACNAKSMFNYSQEFLILVTRN